MAAITPNPEFWERVRARATALGSDGCTAVNEWNRDCCLLHDVMRRTGMDMNGHAVNEQEQNVIFWECNRQRAMLRLSWLDPRSHARFVGVQIGSWWSKVKRDRSLLDKK